MAIGRKSAGKVRRTLIDAFPEKSMEIDNLLISNLDENIKMAIDMALGRISIWDETYEIAGNLTKVTQVGKVKMIEPMFPNLADDELVLVRKVKKNLAPDVTLLQYLINRVVGRPAEQPLEGISAEDYKLIIEMGSALENPADSLEGMERKPSVITPLTALPENLPNSSIKKAM